VLHYIGEETNDEDDIEEYNEADMSNDEEEEQEE
jgi:hypothetical protein